MALFGGYAPKLQDVTWHCIRFPLLASTPWSNLTNLDLHLGCDFQNEEVLNWTAFMFLLSRNPYLETLVMEVPRFDTGFNAAPIPLLSLHKVQLSLDNISNLKVFLQAIFAPEITTICIDIVEYGGTSFSNIFSILGTQASLLSLLNTIDGCQIDPMSDVFTMHCWDREDQVTFELQFVPLYLEEDTSDLAKMLPAIKQLEFEPLPPQFKIPLFPSVKILKLPEYNPDDPWRIPPENFPSLSNILLPKQQDMWWEKYAETLEQLVGNSRKLEIVVASGYSTLKEEDQEMLEEFYLLGQPMLTMEPQNKRHKCNIGRPLSGSRLCTGRHEPIAWIALLVASYETIRVMIWKWQMYLPCILNKTFWNSHGRMMSTPQRIAKPARLNSGTSRRSAPPTNDDDATSYYTSITNTIPLECALVYMDRLQLLLLPHVRPSAWLCKGGSCTFLRFIETFFRNLQCAREHWVDPAPYRETILHNSTAAHTSTTNSFNKGPIDGNCAGWSVRRRKIALGYPPSSLPLTKA
ncbi:hypothetical protein M422DRAFT_243623 [Sphaerobolus stellatus SS14]|nr:hypothetical protein M422DRAFT_243623 [Sphaerobolus stellatus SS14]